MLVESTTADLLDDGRKLPKSVGRVSYAAYTASEIHTPLHKQASAGVTRGFTEISSLRPFSVYQRAF